jgi:hypothetical protein
VDELVQELLAGVGETPAPRSSPSLQVCLVQRFRRRDGLGVPLLAPAGLAAADQQQCVAHRVEDEPSALPRVSSAPPDQADEHLTRLIREYSQVAWADKVFGSSYTRKGVRLGPEAAANDCRNPVLWLVRRP